MERIETFLAVAEHGGIAKAVQAGVDQGRIESTSKFHVGSQYSRQIAALEAAVGTMLFDRSGRSFGLTERGRTLWTAANDWRESLAALRPRDDAPIDLTLVAGDSVLSWRVIPRLMRFLEEWPRVRLTLRASAAPMDDVVEGRAHLGIGTRKNGEQPPEGLRTARLGPRQFALFVPRARRTEGLDLARLLQGGPLAVVSSERGPHEMACRMAKVTPTVAFECETVPQAARAVASGAFAAILPVEAQAELGASVAEMVEIATPAGSRATLHLLARRKTLGTVGGDGLFKGVFAALSEPAGPRRQSNR
jgi:DNA-binding transcriptional LysR family regulator